MEPWIGCDAVGNWRNSETIPVVNCQSPEHRRGLCKRFGHVWGREKNGHVSSAQHRRQSIVNLKDRKAHSELSAWLERLLPLLWAYAELAANAEQMADI